MITSFIYIPNFTVFLFHFKIIYFSSDFSCKTVDSVCLKFQFMNAFSSAHMKNHNIIILHTM